MTYVVVAPGKWFLGSDRNWIEEYPDAEIFTSIALARKAAKRAKPVEHGAVIIGDYGTDHETEMPV